MALNAWAAFDERIVMSANVPAIVARSRILLAVDMVTRIWPSQPVDGAPALRCARAPHTTFGRSGHRAPHAVVLVPRYFARTIGLGLPVEQLRVYPVALDKTVDMVTVGLSLTVRLGYFVRCSRH